jgi:hypothetical protein
VLGAYDLLNDLGWQARYPRVFQPTGRQVRDAVHY